MGNQEFSKPEAAQAPLPTKQAGIDAETDKMFSPRAAKFDSKPEAVQAPLPTKQAGIGAEMDKMFSPRAATQVNYSDDYNPETYKSK